MSYYLLNITDHTNTVLGEEGFQADTRDEAIVAAQNILRGSDHHWPVTGDLYISDDGALRALGEVRP